MCANLNLSVEAFPALVPCYCSYISSCPLTPPPPLSLSALVLPVDMLVNWSLADCIDCSLAVHCLPSHSIALSSCLLTRAFSPVLATPRELGLNAGN